MKAYGTSKLMTIMSNTEMVRRLKGSGIDSFICQPGMSSTPVYGKTDKSHVMANVLDAAQKVLGQTEERGAVPLLYAATAPEMSGKPCAVRKSGCCNYLYHLHLWKDTSCPAPGKHFGKIPCTYALDEIQQHVS